MAVKPMTLTLALHHHIAVVRPNVHCKLPHHQPTVSSTFHQDCCHRKQDDPHEVSKPMLPSKVTKWQYVKDNIKNTASQVYHQVVNAKELGKVVTWNIPGITPPNIQSHRVTIIQPVVAQTETEASRTTGDLNSQTVPEQKSRKHVKLKAHTREKDVTATGSNVKEKSANTEEGETLGNVGVFNQDSARQLSNSKDDFIPKTKENAVQILQPQEIGHNSNSDPPSRFKYGIFDVESIFKRIQEQFVFLESLTNFKMSEDESNATDKKATDKQSIMKHSEEFEIGNQGDVYGDVIIQFKQKTYEAAGDEEGSYNPSVSTIFRDNLDEWDQRRMKAPDPSKDTSQVVPRLKEVRTKADSSYLLDQLSLLKSLQLPSVAKSIQRFNKKFIKEQSQPLKDKESDNDVGGFYFDSNSPLIDMTQVMGEMQQLKPTAKKDENVNLSSDSSEKDENSTKNEFQDTRRTKVEISQASIKARMKSLTVAVSKPTTTASTLLRLQRLCKHLSEYPETRDIAVKENLIAILLRQRISQCDDANRAEIRRALALMGYADPVKGKGIRILSVDGGGTRGVIPIEILKSLEESCQQKIGDMFDFVIGVSSGAVTSFLLCIARASVDECEQLYKDLSVKVFGRNRFLGTSNLVLNHAFYDTEGWIQMLKGHFRGMGNLNISETARDASCPKVASVATLMNFGMLRDYLFRNYNLPPGSVSFYQGSSKYRLWEALRASSAAPGYFEEFKLDDHVFQDGGVLTNNPCALAVHECRLLWPDTPIQCVVSVGTGRYDPMDQELPVEYSSLKTKLFKVLCSATDTEAVHIILKDLLPADKYFRFNPIMSEDFVLDESKPEKLEKMQRETREYLVRNELKLMQASGVLTREKSSMDKISDWITLQKKMRIPMQKKSYWRD